MEYLKFTKTGKRSYHQLVFDENNLLNIHFFGHGAEIHFRKGRPAIYHCEYQYHNLGWKANWTKYLDKENMVRLWNYAKERGILS